MEEHKNNQSLKRHIVKVFDEELQTLRENILQLGFLAKEQLANALSSLITKNHEQAGKVVSADSNINKLDRKIQTMALTIMARRQPTAVDLRSIIVALKISSKIERIADYAANIAQRVMLIGNVPHLDPAIRSIMRIGNMTMDLFNNVLDSYNERDIDKAIKVWSSDAEVDDMYVSLLRELLTYMMEDPRQITVCTHLLFIGRNLERIGDHATSIAENVHFMIKGCPPSGERPKGVHWGEINNIDV
ncbi:MAG: phosphate signaling complex protein PhoU [Candidatus Magnetoovum sp. WYHC-5]|nr:phosphate signaling complex protein PhoU [Candidatus Magnetoovum sp. WYHC-5]